MYKHILKVHGEYLAKEQALPQNASADGNGETMDFSGGLGSQEVVAEAVADIALADTKVLSVTLMQRDAGGEWESLGTVCSLTASGPTAIEAGTILGRFVPPTDAKAETKAVITTNDAAATGSVSVYPHYLAR